MAIRNRNRSRDRNNGTLVTRGWRYWKNSGAVTNETISYGPYNGHTYTSELEDCTDAITRPPYGDKDLDLVKTSISSGFSFEDKKVVYEAGSFIDYRTTTAVDYLPLNTFHIGKYPGARAVNWEYYKTGFLADLSPNKPAVDLPLFFFELREFPKMLRDLGNVLKNGTKARDTPGHWLAYQFGWAPLISDLHSLLTFGVEYENRMTYLNNLKQKHSIRRNLGGDEWEDYVATEGPAGFHHKLYVEGTRKVWGTASVALKDEHVGNLQRFLDLERLVGLRLRAKTLWDAIPWSWLIDYFLNIGDALEARGGLLDLKVHSICIMCRDHEFLRAEPSGAIGQYPVSFDQFSTFRTSKRRRVFSAPTPSITSVPRLSGKQVAILGALSLARYLK